MVDRCRLGVGHASVYPQNRAIGSEAHLSTPVRREPSGEP
jgi:hypothetical protein